MRAFLVVCGTFAGLCCVEVGLRIYGFRYSTYFQLDNIRGWAHQPGDSAWYTDEGQAFVTINSHGFRDRERRIPNENRSYRIAILGDSFVEARQVELEDTFCAIAEKKLNQRVAGDARRIEVLNFGVLGYSTAQELLTFRDSVVAYRPDIVILAICIGNDLKENVRKMDRESWRRPYFELQGDQLVLDSSFRNSQQFQLRQTRFVQSWYTLRSHLRIAQLVSKVRNTWFTRKLADHEPRDFSYLLRRNLDKVLQKPQNDDWEDAWLLTQAIIQQTKSETREMGAQFGVIQVSMGIQVTPDVALRQEFIEKIGAHDLNYPNRRLSTLATTLGIAELDLANELKMLSAQRNEHYHGFDDLRVDGHWNIKGHQVIGELVANWIEKVFDLSRTTTCE